MLYAKTDFGRTAIRDRSNGLSPRCRSIFLLLDGTRTLEEVLKLTSGTAEEVDKLVLMGMVAQVEDAKFVPDPAPAFDLKDTVPAALEEREFAVRPASIQPKTNIGKPRAASSPGLKEQYRKAFSIALPLTESLGLKGFRLNLEVRAAEDVDDLRSLLPKIRAAAGVEKCRELDESLQ